MSAEHHIPESECACGYKIDGTAGFETARAPIKDDVSICAQCGRLSLFNEDGTLREPTFEEMYVIQRMPEYPRVVRVQKVIQDRYRIKDVL
jgi:hypothetical protein